MKYMLKKNKFEHIRIWHNYLDYLRAFAYMVFRIVNVFLHKYVIGTLYMYPRRVVQLVKQYESKIKHHVLDMYKKKA